MSLVEHAEKVRAMISQLQCEAKDHHLASRVDYWSDTPFFVALYNQENLPDGSARLTTVFAVESSDLSTALDIALRWMRFSPACLVRDAFRDLSAAQKKYPGKTITELGVLADQARMAESKFVERR